MGSLTFKTIMPKGTAHTVTTPMVIKTKTPRYTKMGHRLSSACGSLCPLCAHRALRAEPKLPMNGTPWKGSCRALSQKTKIFVIKSPIVTPCSKVLDGGAILHKARTITRKGLVKTPTNTWKAWTQLSIDTIFFGLVTGSRAKEGAQPSVGLMVSWYLPSANWLAKSKPKSINLLFQIFVLIFKGTRASTGKLTDVNMSLSWNAPLRDPHLPVKSGLTVPPV